LASGEKGRLTSGACADEGDRFLQSGDIKVDLREKAQSNHKRYFFMKGAEKQKR